MAEDRPAAKAPEIAATPEKAEKKDPETTGKGWANEVTNQGRCDSDKSSEVGTISKHDTT
jgi:hypothetical protein